MALLAQQPGYSVSNVTGQLTISATVNLLPIAQNKAQAAHFSALRALDLTTGLPFDAAADRAAGGSFEIPRAFRPVRPRLRAVHKLSRPAFAPRLSALSSNAQGLNVTGSSSFGFMGMTHYDERNANGGNQYSIEPPSQGLAVANGFVVEGVNNAFQVYSTSGTSLLPAVLATSQVFGLPPAIIRSTPPVCGPDPTDIRVFYDQTLNRFFVLQREQDYDSFCDPLPASHIYMAVSETSDPTGTYNVYSMNTTDSQSSGCPCIADYPEIGADQYGIYITWNEFNSNFSFPTFLGAKILAISKASLAANANAPTALKFSIPVGLAGGFETAIQPAYTPPGGSYVLGNGGLEYFVSSQTDEAVSLAVWALTPTSSLASTNPNLSLLQIIVPAPLYEAPPNATQRLGALSLGSSLEALDGSDSRVQSVEYVGAKLYVTLGAGVTDDNGNFVAGGLYAILAPTFRGSLSAQVLREGYIYVNGEHILRPAVAINAQGQGAIVFTLTGPDYFPSAAFLPVTMTPNGSPVSLVPMPGSSLQIAGVGLEPEDGFSGYPAYGGSGVARWGDYSGAVVSPDGSIWMGTEYIPNAPRTPLANWGTYLIHYVP